VPQRRRGRGDTTVPPVLRRLGVTSREADVLRLVALGLSNQDIAGRLYLAPRTVKTHIEHLLAKTSLTSRVQLAAPAIAEGIGPADRSAADG
jgi:DNA-binding NarL/FixJ family response regulator